MKCIKFSSNFLLAATLTAAATVPSTGAKTLSCGSVSTVSESKTLTVAGATYNLTTTRCANDNTDDVTKKMFSLLPIGDANTKRDSSQCTTSNCACGGGCNSLACSNPPGTLNIADCKELTSDLVSNGGSMGTLTDPIEAEAGTCLYEFAPAKTSGVEYCWSDFGNLGLALETVCPGALAVCVASNTYTFTATSA